MKIEQLKIEIEGFFIEAELFAPEAEKFPVAVFCHALGGQMKNFSRTASYFAEHGIGALCFQFRGGGPADLSGFPTAKMTLFSEKADLFAVLDYVKKQTYAEKVILFGASQGGMVAAMAAEERHEIAGMVLLYPGFSISDHLSASFPAEQEVPARFELFGMELGADYVLSMRGYDTFREVGEFDRPVLVIHGACDKLVPLAYSERAQKRYKNASLIVLEGEKHGFSAEGNARAAEAACAFLKERI